MAKRILVVDDDEDVTQLLSVKLRMQGHEVHLAGNGVSCVSAALHCRPDLIILDIGLPAGDGFKTLEWLQHDPKLAPIPVVVYSARRSAGRKVAALTGGAAAFVSKTGRLEELLWTVDRVLEGNWPLEAS